MRMLWVLVGYSFLLLPDSGRIVMSIPWEVKMNTITTEEVLRILDKYINRSYLGAVPNFNSEVSLYSTCFGRLRVFRGSKEWIVVIETIEVCKGPFFFHCVYLYGNCLTEQGLIEPCEEVFSPDQFTDETGIWAVKRYHFAVQWRGRHMEFAPSIEEYSQLGIVFPTDRMATDDLEPWELMWYVGEKLSDELFYSDMELLELVLQRLFCHGDLQKLKKLLDIRLWEHPDVYAGEVPSDTQSFQLIAQIIATGNAALWQQADASRFNSHWRYWVIREQDKEG